MQLCQRTGVMWWLCLDIHLDHVGKKGQAVGWTEAAAAESWHTAATTVANPASSQ